MQEVFNQFKELFEKRYSLISVGDMGEDSVRYDFFIALKETKKLNPWQMQVEYSMHKETFIPRNTEKSKRGENPQVDLWVNESSLKMCVEFGFFRRNSNDEGSISVTENLLKMLNDFVRLALQSNRYNSDAYFACVADKKMLDTGLTKYKGFAKFPAKNYEFDSDILNQIINTYKSAKKIDQRFLPKMQELNLKVFAELIFDKDLTSTINEFKTKMLIWKITSSKALK